MLETTADIFLKEDAQSLLFNKFVIFIGDSVIRSMYKDFVKLLQTNDHLTDQQLKIKGEFYFENDILLEGGQKGVMSNETSYTEVREYRTEYHMVKFYFITRCYSDYLLSICNDIEKDTEKPDIVIMNSGVWDLTRYGPNSIPEYKQNLPKGIYSLIKVLPSYTLFIWVTTLPLSKDIKGGFVIPEIELSKSKLREDVLEANSYAARVIDELKLDLIDLHYYFVNQIQRRAKDGIHWDATAHRRITNLILNHVSEAWSVPPPYRILENPENKGSLIKLNKTSTNQLPTQLKNQLNDIDLKRHLIFSKSVENNEKNINNLINRQKSAPNDGMESIKKRKRSSSQDRASSANNKTNNNPIPLMELNIPSTSNNSNKPLTNNNSNKRLCVAPKNVDFTKDLNDPNQLSVNFDNNDSVGNGINLYMRSFNN